MSYLHRTIEPKILELTEYFPVVAVLGARQVGKTTLVQNLPIPELKTITFDPIQDIGGAREDPDLFLHHQPRPLFLDEIQYAPPLLASLKRAVDLHRAPGQYILSGSQNLSALRTISESLAGRVAVVELQPLSQNELASAPARRGYLEKILFGQAFADSDSDSDSDPTPPAWPLHRAIWQGGFPGLTTLPPHLFATYFDSYKQTYIDKDVRTTATLSSIPTFGRFFSLLSALTAREINHAELGRELGVDRKTAVFWTDILTTTFQWREVPAYSSNAIKRVAGKAKGYFVDTGLACHQQRIMSPDHLAEHPLGGSLFETFVVGEIFKHRAAWPYQPNVYHHRAYSGTEVDLILELNGVLHPIEIKMSTKPSLRDIRAFDALRATFPKARVGTGLVVCAIAEARPLNESVWAVPWWSL